jgi:hypothetical protein
VGEEEEEGVIVTLVGCIDAFSLMDIISSREYIMTRAMRIFDHFIQLSI